MTPARPIHVAHLLYRFAAGGMENVIVQLINHLPRHEFRHSVIAITDVDADFARRIDRHDVEFIELRKPPGQPFRLYPSAYGAFRRLAPDVLHSCNLAALEFAPAAALAGVPRRVHAEHGWDVHDPDGTNPRYRMLRRLYKHFVHQFVAVSPQLFDYLRESVGVRADRLRLVPNGVDTDRFRPPRIDELPPQGYPFVRPDHWVIGTVGRLAPIKNQTLLAEAFVRLVESNPVGAERLRLAIVGDGPLKDGVVETLSRAGLLDRLWMPGGRSDIPEILRALDCFVLPSLAEGTSCTLQEAMATELPIVATDVGGNSNLLGGGRYGHLCRSGDASGMAGKIRQVFDDLPSTLALARAARAAVVERFALAGVIDAYRTVFGPENAGSAA